VNVWPWLLPGEKEEPITLRPQDCRAHGTSGASAIDNAFSPKSQKALSRRRMG
jgi:hypothetical protein